jgi:PAS domain S-box-containing protein
MRLLLQFSLGIFMRTNLPVTNTEYPIGDETLIVSKTDTKGRMTYFNNQFVEASGFTEAELINQPHNMIRHPDMPPEAFEDMWATLKAGKPWAGAVKNRRKNGDFYWVQASATPIWEDGKVTGYMSVRSKLPADQREEAERVYVLLRANKAQAYRVTAGVIRRRSLFDHLAVFTRTLKARLITLISAQAIFMAMIGLVGILATNNSNTRMKSIYDDRAVPLAQLFEINDRMKEASIMLYAAAIDGRAGKSVSDVAGKVAANSEAIDKVWGEYIVTYLTPEEKGVAESFMPKRKDYVDNGIKAGLALLAANKFDELAALQAGKTRELFSAAKSDLDKLVAIQVKEAKFEFDSAQREYMVAVGVVLAVLCFALVFGSLLGFNAIRAISRPLAQLNAAMAKIAQGVFTNRLTIERDDEIGVALRNIQAMQGKLGFEREEGLDKARLAELEKRAALMAMAENVESETNQAVGGVSNQTERMAGSAAVLSEGAVTLEKNSGSVAAAAEQALANAQTLTEAATQLNKSINEIATQVSSSRTLTMEAVSTSAKAQTTIARLSEAATKVDAVTNLISEIASQTNLLALNATIEAARAGEAGRGFAVVASEVKSLAEQTAKATSEIAQQISEIQEATRESVTSISAIGDVIRNVDSFSAQITSAMEMQRTVTQEISRTIAESSQAAREVATQIVNVSSQAVQTGRQAAEIRDGSAEIASQVDTLRSTLIRVVRTSTADVDRRLFARVDIDRHGTIEAGGKSHPVTIRDFSGGGAMVSGPVPGVAADTHVVLAIDGIPHRFAGIVSRVDADAIGIGFKETEITANVARELRGNKHAA